ncbi:MAG: hypothetical protein M3Q58_02775, partial [Bacteroidota bacterium]|nr:hypothetical protein [Bacteroidota bacterium]
CYSLNLSAQAETIRIFCYSAIDEKGDAKDEMNVISISPDYFTVASESKKDTTFLVTKIEVANPQKRTYKYFLENYLYV